MRNMFFRLKAHSKTAKKTCCPNMRCCAGNLVSKDGKYSLYCAVIVKKVDAKTRGKVGINELLRSADDVQKDWDYAQEGGRAGKGRVIIEGFIDFDYEITLLTVRHVGGTTFCAPVGHRQEKGDYQESWQPQAMSPIALAESERVARAVTEALGGRGLFGVELFIKGDQVWFSEVSPRPHDTGLVTLISQDLSQFALHARAILGLPIPLIRQFGPSASAVILVEGQSTQTAFANLGAALSEPDTALRLFGKPEVNGQRRMGVALARDESIEAARAKATRAAKAVVVEL